MSLRRVSRNTWASALLLTVAVLAITSNSLVNTFGATTSTFFTMQTHYSNTIIGPPSLAFVTTETVSTESSCQAEKQTLDGDLTSIMQLQTQGTQLEQQAQQQQQTSANAMNQVYQNIVTDAATLQGYITMWETGGNNIMQNSGECTPCYNVGFSLYVIAQDLQQQHDDLQQQSKQIALALLILEPSTQQQLQNSISFLNKVNQAISADGAAINKDAGELEQLYASVLDNHIDTSGVGLSGIATFTPGCSN